jgi:hypothetical protein
VLQVNLAWQAFRPTIFKPVGWVERSDTHHVIEQGDGFRKGSTRRASLIGGVVMRVRCVKLFNSGGLAQTASPWLTIGKLYDVLTIEFEPQTGWSLRLISDAKNEVALFPLESFDIVSARVPPSWIASWGDNGSFDLSPQRWTLPGFWEEFYDREPMALAVFNEEVARLVDE